MLSEILSYGLYTKKILISNATFSYKIFLECILVIKIDMLAHSKQDFSGKNIKLGNTLDFNQSFRFSPPLPNGDRLQRRRSCQNLLGQYDLREGGSQKSLMLYQDCVHQVKLTKRVKFCGGFCDFIANLSPAKLGLRLSLAI